MQIVKECLFVVLSYLIGCINMAYLFSTKVKHTDIRKYGSGNAGATNVLRTFGIKSALLVFTGDALKAIISVGIAMYFNMPDYIISLCAFACVAGHNWPIFLDYRGGKGVSSTIGIFIILNPKLALIGIIIGLSVVAISKMVSLGSLTGIYSGLILYIVTKQATYMIVTALVLALFTTYQHRQNIIRIIHGEESKLTFKKEGK